MSTPKRLFEITESNGIVKMHLDQWKEGGSYAFEAVLRNIIRSLQREAIKLFNKSPSKGGELECNPVILGSELIPEELSSRNEAEKEKELIEIIEHTSLVYDVVVALYHRNI
jgi:hypothetical protein